MQGRLIFIIYSRELQTVTWGRDVRERYTRKKRKWLSLSWEKYVKETKAVALLWTMCWVMNQLEFDSLSPIKLWFSLFSARHYLWLLSVFIFCNIPYLSKMAPQVAASGLCSSFFVFFRRDKLIHRSSYSSTHQTRLFLRAGLFGHSCSCHNREKLPRPQVYCFKGL